MLLRSCGLESFTGDARNIVQGIIPAGAFPALVAVLSFYLAFTGYRVLKLRSIACGRVQPVVWIVTSACFFSSAALLLLSVDPHFAQSALARYTPAGFICLVERHGSKPCPFKAVLANNSKSNFDCPSCER
jgi:hypothetical protein